MYIGRAISANTTANGGHGYKEEYSFEALREAADSLDGCPILEHSNNDSRVVGKVVDSYFCDGSVMYEAEIYFESVQNLLDEDCVEVAPRITHIAGNPNGYRQIEELEFEALFLCASSSECVPGIRLQKQVTEIE